MTQPKAPSDEERVRDLLDSGALDDAFRECVHGHYWKGCFPCSQQIISVCVPGFTPLLAQVRAEAEPRQSEVDAIYRRMRQAEFRAEDAEKKSLGALQRILRNRAKTWRQKAAALAPATKADELHIEARAFEEMADAMIGLVRAEAEEKRGVKHGSACGPWCKMPHHAFSSTRRLPLGEIDKSLQYCDTCGLTVEALMHNVSDEENGEAIVAALEATEKAGEGEGRCHNLQLPSDGPCDCAGCRDVGAAQDERDALRAEVERLKALNASVVEAANHNHSACQAAEQRADEMREALVEGMRLLPRPWIPGAQITVAEWDSWWLKTDALLARSGAKG